MIFEAKLFEKQIQREIIGFSLSEENTFFTTFKINGNELDEEVKLLFSTLSKFWDEEKLNSCFPIKIITEGGEHIFQDCSPIEIDFGEEVYTSDPTVELKITWKYNSFTQKTVDNQKELTLTTNHLIF